MKRKIISIVVALGLLLGLLVIPTQAATGEEIEEAIADGLTWLVGQQTDDGYWQTSELDQRVATTAFAVVKLEDRAYELGLNPFQTDPGQPDYYEYSQNVIDGLDYLFSQAGYYEGEPGICWMLGTPRECYTTGIVMMAIAASRAPDRVITSGAACVLGKTYMQVLQEAVYYYEDAQKPLGGWKYFKASPAAEDNSTTGYAVLGLRYAEYFGCTIPEPVKTGLNNWINTIQCTDPGGNYGGSSYTFRESPPYPPCYWVNVLKTGNLLFEMSFVGDTTETPRVQDAIGYIQNKWDTNADPGWRINDDTSHYQAMYCLMKGFDSLDIDTITVIRGGEATEVDWFDEMATVIVDQQNPDGSWSGCATYCFEGTPSCQPATQILCTIWALLTLEKVAPPPPVNVEVDVPECICDDVGLYDVFITYTVERFLVDGTLTVKKNGEVEYTVDLEDFTGTAYEYYTIDSPTPGTYTWSAELDVEPVGGGTPAHADDEDWIKVCETPAVGDIPDQTGTPFEPINLFEYLENEETMKIKWSASAPPEGWTVSIYKGTANVTAPEGASEPATITFTASTTCCDGVVCSDSDDVTFTPNRLPDCSEAYASLDCLWPPNHKFVDIGILGVTDPDGDPVTITITSITSDEPTATDKGSGGAKHAPDADGVGTDTASIRAERSGNGDGRVYVINFTASDGKGGECQGSVTVKVPHDQSDKTCPATDSGQDYDATTEN